jgi:hypothetical protein
VTVICPRRAYQMWRSFLEKCNVSIAGKATVSRFRYLHTYVYLVWILAVDWQVWVLLILYSLFTTSMAKRERCYSFAMPRTPHETSRWIRSNSFVLMNSIEMLSRSECDKCVDSVLFRIEERNSNRKGELPFFDGGNQRLSLWCAP